MFKTTIDSIIGDISLKISKLRVLAGEHHNRHLIHNEEVAVHTELAASQAALRDKAAKIADNFENLLK